MKTSKFAKQQAALNEKPDARPRGRPKTRLSTLSEVAEYLHVAHSTIYRLIDTKQLPYLRIGSVLRFDLPTVLRWAEGFTERGDRLTWEDDHPELKRHR